MNASRDVMRANHPEPRRKSSLDLGIKVIVINRADAVERLQFQTWQLRNIGLGFIRLDAYTPDTIPKVNRAYWKSWRKPLRANQKARLLSHGLAWDWVVENGPALILEDDAILANSVPEILQNLEMITEMEYLSLEVRGRSKLLGKHSIPIGHGIASHRLYLDKTGTAAYVLWPSGAEKLIARASKGAVNMDGLAQWATKVKCYQVDPACAVQLDIAGKYGLNPPVDSPSQVSDEKFRNVFTVRQIGRLFRAQLHKVWRLARYGIIADRRKVELKPEYFDI